MTEGSKKSRRQALKDELRSLADSSKAREEAVTSAKRQLRAALKLAIIVLVVIWLAAIAFVSGLKTYIPLYVAGVLTVAAGVAAFIIRRNLVKSEELGAMLGEGELSKEDRLERIQKLEARVEKGEAAAIMAKAQLEMQETPRDALATLEKVDLAKQQKPIANQVRGMRAIIHLNLADVAKARELVDEIVLDKMPDLKARANLAGVVAEAWARSGNPIEAKELLDKYDPEDKQFEDVRVQLFRARVFACVHQNDLPGMKKAMKQLQDMSPQLLAAFVSGKRIHPLLQQEAKKRLEKSGLVPRQRIVSR